ncbi:MAG TPA: hypothetical protein VFV66_24045 [Nonomuraea sp.]|nr:hypothetical protein [Nonomuraea sp.]
MPSDNRKRAIRAYMAEHGVPYAVAARHIDQANGHGEAAHRHPRPALGFLADLPYSAGRDVDNELAASVVAACRAGCRPCQDALIPRLLPQRPTVAVLACAVFGWLPGAGLASATTRTWQPLAQQASRDGDGTAAFAAVADMTPEQVSELLEDALDLWAAGAADVHLVHLDDDPGGDGGDLDSTPIYALCPMITQTGNGPLPGLVLVAETSAAGPADLRTRCAWPGWDLTVLPDVDTRWRVRLEIGSRSIAAIAHIDAEGCDDILLWEAPKAVSLPEDWFDVVDRAGHMLLVGPAADPSDAALQVAADAGELSAVIGRVSFL